MEQVYYHLDIIEKDYFGLQYTDPYNVPHWLDPTKIVKKQVKSEDFIDFLHIFKYNILVSCSRETESNESLLNLKKRVRKKSFLAESVQTETSLKVAQPEPNYAAAAHLFDGEKKVA